MADGSTVNWAVDAMPTTLNAFQADADSATTRITGALLPTLFPMDATGQPKLNPDYLESAKIIEREPKQVVLYKLNQQAVWSDGREIGAPDSSPSGGRSAARTPPSGRPGTPATSASRRSSAAPTTSRSGSPSPSPTRTGAPSSPPLYPKEVTGSPDTFNDGARTTLKNTAGPFQLKSVSKAKGTVTLTRNPRWWGDKAKLDTLVFRAVAPKDRTKALADGTVHVTDVDSTTANRIALALRDGNNGGQPLTHGPRRRPHPRRRPALLGPGQRLDEEQAEIAQAAREKTRKAVAAYGAEQKALRSYAVRKSLEPAYTQLALNGESGPSRTTGSAGRWPAPWTARSSRRPCSSRSGSRRSRSAATWPWPDSPATRTGSGALGDQNTEEAQALLADAGGPGAARPRSRGHQGGQRGGEEGGQG
ncbi:hypothetical protein KMB26_02020 [Streptomyces sp. CYG20]|uniref:ABC transporter substrate-binding protein n=1 Tax=Streptomyces sp. CYG20 TaxID=2838873 RepID=UPI001BFF9FB8|nr:ABC transporter substrate-binding protein [Streptomyces sp. CYG20]MBT3108145.1 hypothetical protein [Streptomyces sp. CYG20]